MIKKIILLLSCFLLLCSASFAQKVRPPQQLRLGESYQREVEIKWNKTLLENIEWEIQMEGRPAVRTTAITHTLTGLEPQSEYEVKVRMVRGEEYSDYAKLKFTTKGLNYRVDDPNRIPYLRCVQLDGTCPQQLPLYFTDLAHAQAKISCKLNGKPVTAENGVLHLVPENYSDKLEVFVDEGNNRTFKLLYFINISKDN